MRDRRFKFSFIVICVYAFLSILSFFSPYDPTLWGVLPRDLPPSFEHILGTNSMGQDIFWRLTFAVRNSLLLGIITAFFSRIIAVIVGLITGFKGGLTDRITMVFNDSLITLPIIPILILISALIKEQLTIVSLGFILGIFSWAWDARIIRSQVLSLKERSFTYTAVLSGMKMFELLTGEYFPFLISLILATAINSMFWAMGMEITLAFLGLSNLEIPTLGTMLHWAVRYQAMLLGYWWWIATPVLAIIFLFVALYLLSVSISEYLDPRVRVERRTRRVSAE